MLIGNTVLKTMAGELRTSADESLSSSTLADVDTSSDTDRRETLLYHLAHDYAKYMRVDVSAEKKALEEEIEDTLTRLDEFCSLVDMVRSDDSLCLSHTLPSIYTKSQELETMFLKIDKLEQVVNIVKQNLDVMEEKVAVAEHHLENSSVKKLFNSLQKPLFSKKNADSKKSPKYEPPEIFRTKDFFSKSFDMQRSLEEPQACHSAVPESQSEPRNLSSAEEFRPIS